MQDNRMSERLSQKVETNVRQMIGDLTMQTIVLKSMLELQGEQQNPNQPNPAPPPPQPVPPNPGEQPGRKDPEPPPPAPEHAASVTRGNGKASGQLNR
jgi:hypothetical protein